VSEARDEVARLLEEGRTVAEIARVTGLATNTVRYHRDRVRAAMTDRPIAQTAPPIEVVSQIATRERVADSLAEGLSRAETDAGSE
jgi:transposase-like protein